MLVYAVLVSVPYEGQDLQAVFGSREQAFEYARQVHSERGQYVDVGVVECELGREIDFYGEVEWVE